MDCESVHEALSAVMDSEPLPPHVTRRDLDDHLNGCDPCRAWVAQVERLGAMCRVEAAPSAPDLREQLLRLFDSAARARSTSRLVGAGLRLALMVVATLQLAVVVPALLLGHDREAPVHVAHEMGSFELAVALGLLAVACRPRWAAGLAWFTTPAAATLTATALTDMAHGSTSVADEAPHLLVAVAAGLLIALARRQRPTPTPVTERRAGPPSSSEHEPWHVLHPDWRGDPGRPRWHPGSARTSPAGRRRRRAA